MSRITTIGELKKIIENLDDDFNIEMRVNREIPSESLMFLSYPWGLDTDYQKGFEFDDVGVSDKVLCLSVKVPPEMCDRIRNEDKTAYDEKD